MYIYSYLFCLYRCKDSIAVIIIIIIIIIYIYIKLIKVNNINVAFLTNTHTYIKSMFHALTHILVHQVLALRPSCVHEKASVNNKMVFP